MDEGSHAAPRLGLMANLVFGNAGIAAQLAVDAVRLFGFGGGPA